MPHILEIKGLTTVFKGDYGDTVSVDHIDCYVDKGETVCIVGESGCGKSVTSLSVMGLLQKEKASVEGMACFDGKDLLAMGEKEKDKIRGNKMTMIFQDPLTSLNPAFTIGSQIMESIRVHLRLNKEESKKRAVEMLQKAGMPDAQMIMRKYPHTLSGGMRQRAMIAMALACHPQLVIADEPTTALDVTIQAQIMRQLKQLQQEMGMALILITHDMGLVAQMADRVYVMYAGQMVEHALAEELFAHPAHPYTKALLAASPGIRDTPEKKLVSIPGMAPERYDDIKGCRFAQRCPYAQERCLSYEGNELLREAHTAKCCRANEFSSASQ